jgi:hypothetical protein
MRGFKALALAAVAAFAFTAVAVPKAQAQINVEIGAAPDCPYGYYDAAPYNCAPYGYYGPEWFNGGVFIGAGRWFHGPDNFQGHVNNSYHPEHGYNGALPARGEKARPENDVAHNNNFKGNEMRDGRGHAVGGDEHKR